MVRIDQTVETAVSPAIVFDYIADPVNHPIVMPSLISVGEVADHTVGKTGTYTFKTFGKRFTGRFTDTVFDHPTTRSYDLTGDLNGTVTWTVEGTGEGSRLRHRIDVQFPGPAVLGPVTDRVTKRMLTKEVETMLANIKAQVEVVEIPA